MVQREDEHVLVVAGPQHAHPHERLAAAHVEGPEGLLAHHREDILLLPSPQVALAPPRVGGPA